MTKFYRLKRSLLAILAFGSPNDFAKLIGDKSYFDYISNSTVRDSHYCLTLDDIDYLIAHTINEPDCLSMLNHIIGISRGKMLVCDSANNTALPCGVPRISARVALFLTKLDSVACSYIFTETFMQHLICNITLNNTWTIKDFINLSHTDIMQNLSKDLLCYFTKSDIWRMTKDLSPTQLKQLLNDSSLTNVSKALDILYRAYHDLGNSKLISDKEFIDYIILGELCDDKGFLANHNEDLCKIVKYFCTEIQTSDKSKAHLVYDILQCRYPGLLNIFTFNRNITEDAYLTIVKEFFSLSGDKESLIAGVRFFCID